LGLPGEHSEANWLPTQVREATNTLFHLANTRWNRVLFFGTNGTATRHGRYLAGMAIYDDTLAPEGWVIRDIPAAEYAVFETTLRDVGETTLEALTHWLPNSDFEQDIAKPRFDFMPPDTTGQMSRVAVYIPVQKKSQAAEAALAQESH
jgi:predicted transcriptional regulator YdeE